MPNRPRRHDPRELDRQRGIERARKSSTARGYGPRWQKYRKWFIREHPLCSVEGCGSPATDVDHIQAVTGPEDPLFWELGNHVGYCHSCHSKKTVRKDGGFGN